MSAVLKDSVSRLQSIVAECDSDRLAFLDSQKAYIEVGPSFKPHSGVVMFNKDKGRWEASIFRDGRYQDIDEGCSTMKEAIDDLMAALFRERT